MSYGFRDLFVETSICRHDSWGSLSHFAPFPLMYFRGNCEFVDFLFTVCIQKIVPIIRTVCTSIEMSSSMETQLSKHLKRLVSSMWNVSGFWIWMISSSIYIFNMPLTIRWSLAVLTCWVQRYHRICAFFSTWWILSHSWWSHLSFYPGPPSASLDWNWMVYWSDWYLIFAPMTSVDSTSAKYTYIFANLEQW